MPKWTYEKCGHTLWGWGSQPERCPKCQAEMIEGLGVSLEEEEEESEDHHSFWHGCNLPRLWDRSWGPFGPRRRR